VGYVGGAMRTRRSVRWLSERLSAHPISAVPVYHNMHRAAMHRITYSQTPLGAHSRRLTALTADAILSAASGAERCSSADVAQWQSSGFVNRRLSVRARPSAPEATPPHKARYCLAFSLPDRLTPFPQNDRFIAQNDMISCCETRISERLTAANPRRRRCLACHHGAGHDG
jgi:hypothetical protein